MKKNITICVSLISLFSILTAFTMPTQVNNENIVVAENVSDDYETVMKELEEVEKELELSMTEEERIAWTPVVALVTRTAAVVRATVAVVEATAAATRAAVQLATRNSCGQLLTTIFGIAKTTKLNDGEFYNRLDDFQMYQLG
jgi:hypothetical protein